MADRKPPDRISADRLRVADGDRPEHGGSMLMEFVIAFAIVAIFAAGVTPLALRHLADARLTRARHETASLATAVLSYYRDTGAWPYTDADGPAGNGIARVVSSNSVPTAVGEGAGAGAANWGTRGQARLLGDYLYYNNPDDDSSADGANAGQASADWRTDGRGAWRGPYVGAYTFDDPWGHAYVMNVNYAPGGGYAGSVRHKVLVLSAGPDGLWQTPFADHAVEEILGDDIGTLVTVR